MTRPPCCPTALERFTLRLRTPRQRGSLRTPHLRLGRHGGEDVVHQLAAHVSGGVPEQRAPAHGRRAQEQLRRNAQQGLIRSRARHNVQSDMERLGGASASFAHAVLNMLSYSWDCEAYLGLQTHCPTHQCGAESPPILFTTGLSHGTRKAHTWVSRKESFGLSASSRQCSQWPASCFWRSSCPRASSG